MTGGGERRDQHPLSAPKDHLDLLYELEDLYINGHTPLAQTHVATMAKVYRKQAFLDVAEVLFDRIDLESFRMGSGRLNCRALARQLAIDPKKRNAARSSAGYSTVKIPGQRTLEIAVKTFLLSQESTSDTPETKK